MYTDSSMAMKSASQQDLQAQRTRVESLSREKLSPEEEKAKMRSACEGFEAVFIQQMWDQMRATLPKEGLLQSKEEEQWQSMYSQELGKSMASSGGIGLADMMMEQLTRNRDDLGVVSRNTPPRRNGLEIAPAPLLPATSSNAPAQTASASQAAPAPGVQPAGTSPNSAAMSIYEGEAVQPHGDMPDADGNLTGTPAAEQKGAGFDPAEQRATATESTPPNVRQTLDELTSQLLAQGQEVPGLNSPVNDANAPIVTKVTYTSNLPAGQRSGLDPAMLAELHQQNVQKNLAQNAVPPNQKPANPSQPVAAPAFAESLNPVPNRPAAPIAPATKPGVPAPGEDILAGIVTRFNPEASSPRNEILLASLNSSAPASTGLTGIQAQAGGPALRSPENVGHNVALGDPAPGLTEINAPVQGRISSGFGWRHDPLNGQRSWHAGVDIQAQPGESVQASRAGVVSFAGQHPELGNLVVVEHGDGLRTLYGHNAHLSVQVGDPVSQGMELAEAGSSGRAAGTHVHFEVRRDDLALNPEPLLRQPFLQANSLQPAQSKPTGVSHV